VKALRLIKNNLLFICLFLLLFASCATNPDRYKHLSDYELTHLHSDKSMQLKYAEQQKQMDFVQNPGMAGLRPAAFRSASLQGELQAIEAEMSRRGMSIPYQY
jgi:hypothetical protein